MLLTVQSTCIPLALMAARSPVSPRFLAVRTAQKMKPASAIRPAHIQKFDPNPLGWAGMRSRNVDHDRLAAVAAGEGVTAAQ